ncbi:hypothetical protein [Lachnospira multipara]|uniref:hypothetical protein n=1 Tax=Lachnospira multipara TaxID=28051 RepID=UPI000550E1D5|nr:hypothetical protein [Lachnospira multipara]
MTSKIKKILVVLTLMMIIIVYSVVKMIPKVEEMKSVIKVENTTGDTNVYEEDIYLPPDIYTFNVEFFDFDIKSIEIVNELPYEILYDNALGDDDRNYLKNNYTKYAILDLSLTFNYDYNKEYIYNDYDSDKELYLNCINLEDENKHEAKMVYPYENSGRSLFKFDFEQGETKEVSLYYPISENFDNLYLSISIYGWQNILEIPDGSGGIIRDGLAKVDITNLINK